MKAKSPAKGKVNEFVITRPNMQLRGMAPAVAKEKITEFIVARTVNASLPRVWMACTEAAILRQWFGPKGFTMIHARNELHVGGKFHYALRAPDGQVWWGKWFYREINTPRRIVTIGSCSDARGGLTRHPMSPTWPMEMLTTFEFVAQDGGTRITVHGMPVHETPAERATFENCIQDLINDWTRTLQRLEEYLANGWG